MGVHFHIQLYFSFVFSLGERAPHVSVTATLQLESSLYVAGGVSFLITLHPVPQILAETPQSSSSGICLQPGPLFLGMGWRREILLLPSLVQLSISRAQTPSPSPHLPQKPPADAPGAPRSPGSHAQLYLAQLTTAGCPVLVHLNHFWSNSAASFIFLKSHCSHMRDGPSPMAPNSPKE